MSWSSRFGGLARQFSPFGRQSHEVTEQDYSYITPEELASEDSNHAKSSSHGRRDASASTRMGLNSTTGTRAGSNRPHRDSDVLVFRHKKVSYPIHFPAYSIDDGQVTVGAAREQAAKKLETDPRRLRMYCKGRNLNNDARTCREEGLHSSEGAEILCVIGEVVKQDEDGNSGSESGGSVEGGDGATDSREGATTKKKRRRTKKKTRKSAAGAGSASDSGRGTPTHGAVEHLPVPSGLHPRHRAQESGDTSRDRSPQPPATPLTPMGKLVAVAANFSSTIVPQCLAFTQSPPEERAKREFEHKKLTEAILAQVLLKLDAVDTEGDEEARAKRKEMVREAQGWLNRLDGAVK